MQVQGKFYLRIDPLGEGSKWRRTAGQEISAPLLLAFAEQVRQWLKLILWFFCERAKVVIFIFTGRKWLDEFSCTHFFWNWPFLCFTRQCCCDNPPGKWWGMPHEWHAHISAISTPCINWYVCILNIAGTGKWESTPSVGSPIWGIDFLFYSSQSYLNIWNWWSCGCLICLKTGEDKDYSVLANVELKKLFPRKKVSKWWITNAECCCFWWKT